LRSTLSNPRNRERNWTAQSAEGAAPALFYRDARVGIQRGGKHRRPAGARSRALRGLNGDVRASSWTRTRAGGRIRPCVTRSNDAVQCWCDGSCWVPVLSSASSSPSRVQTTLRSAARRISSDNAQVRHICDVILKRDVTMTTVQADLVRHILIKI
jgi:hypothetical protein